MDTIFALSSGRPPAAIAVVRISGPEAQAAARRLAGTLPPPRLAQVRTLRDAASGVLDQALVIAFPGPRTATGEDLVELHLHGGRAVVAAVEAALAAMPSLRQAEPGEFTRRALENGRVDLTQAQGLADLLSAETEGERRAALAAADGAIGRAVAGWAARLADLSARVEAALDYSDEGDVDDAPDPDIADHAALLAVELRNLLERPSVERLRDGPLVVLAGPPNAGKSSLFNALLGREAAIVTDIAGTTRDVIEAVIVRNGNAYRLVDTAGLAEATDDPVERIGIGRANAVIDAADVVLWLGDPLQCPDRAIRVRAKCDLGGSGAGEAVSIHDAATVDRLWDVIVGTAGDRLFQDDVRLHEEQRRRVSEALLALDEVAIGDLLMVAEHLRDAHRALVALTGVDATENMLDALFARFCVGK